jgi:hypothetical protein
MAPDWKGVFRVSHSCCIGLLQIPSKSVDPRDAVRQTIPEEVNRGGGCCVQI